MNTLSRPQQVLILRCLVDGMSIRATTRISGVARNTVARLIVETGKVCADFQHRALRDLPCERVQVDEVWSFVYAKEKNVPRAKSAPPQAGDVWTWIALCADTKLVPTWWVGGPVRRDGERVYRGPAGAACQAGAAHQRRLPGLLVGRRGRVRRGRGLCHAGEALRRDGERPPTRYSLQPLGVHRDAQASGEWQPGPGSGEHVLRGTAEPHHADVHAPVHPADQRLLQEAREPLPRDSHALHALQFLPRPCLAAGHAGDGGGRDGPPVGSRGCCRPGTGGTAKAEPAEDLRQADFKLSHYRISNSGLISALWMIAPCSGSEPIISRKKVFIRALTFASSSFVIRS